MPINVQYQPPRLAHGLSEAAQKEEEERRKQQMMAFLFQQQGLQLQQQQLGQDDKRIQLQAEQQANAQQLAQQQMRQNGPQQGGMFGLHGTSRYQQALSPRSQSQIRGGAHPLY